MFEVEVELLICGVNHEDGSILVLSSDKDYVKIPKRSLESDNNLDELAQSIFESYSNLSTAWTKIFNVGIIQKDNTIIVQYAAIVPWDTQFLKGLFVSVNKIEDKDINNALTKVSSKL